MKKLFLVLALLITNLASANQLKPFVTDYCTMFADGTLAKPGLWKNCCLLHDIHYWYGGTEKDMDQTDLKLKSCVNEVAGSTWANLIYSGVRAGHHSPVKNIHKWNWGWETKRDNNELNAQEIIYVQEELRRLPFTEALIESYIQNNF